MLKGLDNLQRQIDHDSGDMGEVARLCDDFGFPALAFGAGRVAVLCSDDIIAKLYWRPAGQVANLIEKEIWVRSPQEIRELLCPVIDASPGGAVLMERCIPTPAEALNEAGQIITSLSAWGVLDSRVNLGLLDNRVVCYDYGQLSIKRQQALGIKLIENL